MSCCICPINAFRSMLPRSGMPPANIASKGVPRNGFAPAPSSPSSLGPLGVPSGPLPPSLLMPPSYPSPPRAPRVGRVTNAATRSGNVVRLLDVRYAVLDPAEVLTAVADPTAGGVNLFVGAVRDHDHGLGVVRLEYSAHPTAPAELRAVAEEVAA